jgi:radical SAM superfamily enzyme YgiQ (UPF0313 family)
MLPHDNFLMPYGIMYVSSAMKKGGFDVYTKNLTYIKHSISDYLKKAITENQIDCVMLGGFSWQCSLMRHIFRTCKEIKPDIVTVAGGGIITTEPYVAMQAMEEADIGVIGEGELTSCELAESLEAGYGLFNVKGIIWRDCSGNLVMNEKQNVIDDLDQISYPDREGFGYSIFLSESPQNYFGIFSSRSCPYNCTFCFHHEKYRYRNLDSIFTEIDDIVEKYHPQYLHFYDELFSIDKERVLEFCKRITPYSIPYEIYMRVPDVTEELVKALRDSGCAAIGLGLESYSDKILKSMKKNITPAQIDSALRIVKDVGVGLLGNFILGDIEDTEETAEASLNYRASHPEYNINAYMIRTLPGSEIYKKAVKKGIIKDETEFLRDDCPYINISVLTDERWKELSEMFNETAMYAEDYVTDYELSILSTKDYGLAIYTMKCPHCHENTQFLAPILQSISKAQCKSCKSYYTVDAFREVKCEDFQYNNKLNWVIWGANELSLKLLKKYQVFLPDNFRLVDINREKQKLRLYKKKIYDITEGVNAEACIICALGSKKQIVDQIKSDYPNIKLIVLPKLIKKNDKISLIFEELSEAEIDWYLNR